MKELKIMNVYPALVAQRMMPAMMPLVEALLVMEIRCVRSMSMYPQRCALLAPLTRTETEGMW